MAGSSAKGLGDEMREEGYTIEPGANLVGTDLTEANLTEANLTDADLGRANLSGADLSGARLAGAAWDEDTRWPAGFTPPE